MSYYAEDDYDYERPRRPSPVRRERGMDVRFAARPRSPVTRRVESGNRVRVSVETGAADDRYRTPEGQYRARRRSPLTPLRRREKEYAGYALENQRLQSRSRSRDRRYTERVRRSDPYLEYGLRDRTGQLHTIERREELKREEQRLKERYELQRVKDEAIRRADEDETKAERMRIIEEYERKTREDEEKRELRKRRIIEEHERNQREAKEKAKLEWEESLRRQKESEPENKEEESGEEEEVIEDGPSSGDNIPSPSMRADSEELEDDLKDDIEHPDDIAEAIEDRSSPSRHSLLSPSTRAKSEELIYDLEYDLDFKLPKSERRAQFLGDAKLSTEDIDVGLVNNKPYSKVHPTFSGPLTQLVISQSRWRGNAADREELGCEIETVPILTSSLQAEKPAPKVMKWFHLERSMFNFEEFTAAALSSVAVSKRVRHDIAMLLRDVQKRFEKQRHHGREMEPDCVSDIFYSNASSNAEQTASVIFLSFSYHCLEPYSSGPMRALGPGSPMHPIRPLLQAHFLSTTQTRELAQAISTVPSTPQGHCVHLAQFWCLIVDGTTMITCSRLPIEKLCLDVVDLTPKSPATAESHIKVSTGDDQSWVLPLTQHLSWPAFLATFVEKMDAYGTSAVFEHDGVRVNARNWRQIVERAATTPVELQMKHVRVHIYEEDNEGTSADFDSEDNEQQGVRVNPTTDTSGMQPSREPLTDPTLPKQPSSTPVEHGAGLQVFSLVGTSADMSRLADGLHEALMNNQRVREQKLYENAPFAKARDVFDWLMKDDQDADSTLSHELQSLRKHKRKIVRIVRSLFCLFWQIDFEHPVTEKLWGTLLQLLTREHDFNDEGGKNPSVASKIAQAIYEILRRDVHSLASLLTAEYSTYKQNLQPIPEAFHKAWLHLVAAILFAQDSPFDDTPSIRHLHIMSTQLKSASSEVILNRPKVDLEDFEICTENSILALLLSKLAGDVMHGCPDITSSYTDYFQGLDFNITQDPFTRSHQEKVRRFLQEVEAILATLENQLSVLVVFEKSLAAQSTEIDGMLAYSLGTSRQSIVIEDCKARINSRIDKFKGLQRRAEDIGEWQLSMVETNKDRQENAIMVFTIVTIIFLPLSFVSGVFGMNTRDVRNLRYGQWIYWIAALPLTVVVLVGSLWWAGELEAVGSWFAHTMSRSKSTEQRRERPDREEVTARYWTDGRRKEGWVDYEQPARPRRRTTYPHT